MEVLNNEKKDEKMKFAITAEEFTKMKVYQDIENEVNNGVDDDDEMSEFWEGEKVVDLIEKAKDGCGISCSKLAYYYEYEEQYDDSFYWFKKAGELGDENACYGVACAYISGFFPWECPREVCSENPEKAIYWMIKAAELGSEDAIKVMEDIKKEMDEKEVNKEVE